MSDKLTITTNHHLREVIDAWQLSAAEREQFDYLDWVAIDDGRDSASFVRYKGELYDLSDFQVIDRMAPTDFKGWDGYASDSFFSGMLVRYARDEWGELDPEYVIVGYYYC